MIELKQVTKTFDRALAVHSLDIIFRDGITSVLIGPSTSGKSTVIRLIMGLIQPDSGTIYFEGARCLRKPSSRSEDEWDMLFRRAVGRYHLFITGGAR